MRQLEFIEQLYQIEAIRFGNFQLKSGQNSPIYLDLRQIISYPKLLNKTADLLWEKISAKKKPFAHFCGVPYTALPIATCLSLKQDIPMLIRRKENKNYGTNKMIEGVFQSGETCFIIEDVITTGSSVLETAHELKQVGLIVKDAAVLIDREQTGKENLAKHDIEVHAVFDLSTVLNGLLQSQNTRSSDKVIIQSFMNERVK